LSANDTNFGVMFALSGGRAATLSVLYHLNSRDSLFCSTQDTSTNAAAIYLQTTVEPEQMFRGGVGNRSATPTGKNRTLDGCEQPVPAVVDGMSLGHGVGSNPARRKSRRVSIVCMPVSPPTRVSPTVEGGTHDEAGE